MPGSDGLGQETAQAVAVAGDAIVCVVPSQHASQPSMLFAQRRMHPPFQCLPQFLQLANQASALGFAVDHIPPVQGLSAIVRKAQEIERLWPPFAPSPTVRRGEPSELDQPRLVFVQAKPKLGHPVR
jgi:NAD(P)-dependent dehydrogenase (short-subunit alcohol dehydrogenase family)